MGSTCWASVMADTLMGTALFVVLIPGFIISMYPVSKKDTENYMLSEKYKKSPDAQDSDLYTKSTNSEGKEIFTNNITGKQLSKRSMVMRRVFFTKHFAWVSIFIHALVFLILFGLYRVLKEQYWEKRSCW